MRKVFITISIVDSENRHLCELYRLVYNLQKYSPRRFGDEFWATVRR